MKLLVFCPYYVPHLGGIVSHADEFNKHIGGEVTVITPRLPKDSSETEMRYPKVRVIRYPAVEIIPNYPLPCLWDLRFWQLLKMAGKDYDWVISRTRFFVTTVVAGIFAKMNGIRWLHIEHGSDFVKMDNPLTAAIAKIYDYTLGRWSLMAADEVVANSKASAEFCRKLYKGRNYHVIYRGMEEVGTGVERGNSNKVKIMYVGRLIDGKGVGELIEALRGIKKGKWEAVIVGDGPAMEKWQKEAKGLNIKFMGAKKREAALKLMAEGDIVVNPSFTEGLPTSVIEGMLLGKAVVATDVGGTAELVEDGKTGRLYRAHDVEKLKEILEELIANPQERQKLGKAALRETKNKFNWQESAKRYREILSC